jgi:hypothetical protein
VKRPLTRFLLLALLVSVAFAAWVWFRPYDWRPDPAARFQIQQAVFTPDHGYGWLDLFLTRNGETGHDLEKPLFLESSAGWQKSSQDLTLGGKSGEEPTDLWLRFWLEPGDLDGTLKLHLNDGVLTVKSTTGSPAASGPTIFPTSRW